MDFLLQNREHTGRRAFTGLTSANGRAPDPHSVPVDIEKLVWQTHQNNHRTGGRDFGMPGIVSALRVSVSGSTLRPLV